MILVEKSNKENDESSLHNNILHRGLLHLVLCKLSYQNVPVVVAPSETKLLPMSRIFAMKGERQREALGGQLGAYVTK